MQMTLQPQCEYKLLFKMYDMNCTWHLKCRDKSDLIVNDWAVHNYAMHQVLHLLLAIFQLFKAGIADVIKNRMTNNPMINP